MHPTYFTVLIQYILSSLIYNNLYTNAEYIINPGPFSTITCGITEPCHIICNDTQICIGSIFNVYNTITIECSGVQSCFNCTIQTANINTLYALFNGESSFVQSTFIASPNDQNVTINCNALYACELSSFYHSADTVTHICSGESSCSHSLINSTYNDAFSLICTDKRSCSGLCGSLLDLCSSRCPAGLPNNINPCGNTDVNIYSNDIYILCSDSKSCAETVFDLHNFTLLTTEFTGPQTFFKGILTATSNKTNSMINTECNNTEACDQAALYHYGTAAVYHLCNYRTSCSYALINTATDALTIIDCPQTSSCAHTSMALINGVNKVLCTGYDSCQNSQFYAWFAESTTLIASGELSLQGSRLYTQDNDKDVSLICDGLKSCDQSGIYYNASGTIIHECNGVLSCARSNIMSFVAASITCNGTGKFSAPCKDVTLVMPFDFDELNEFQLNLIGEYVALDTNTADIDYMFQIYSLFGIQSSITCIDCAYDNIILIYGLKFNEFCWLLDSCLDDILLEYEPPDIEIILEYKSEDKRNWTEGGVKLDYSNYVISKQHVLMITAALPGVATEWDATIYPPQLQSENSWFSIISLDTTMSGFHIDMSTTSNGAVTLGRDSRFAQANVYAASNNFIWTGYTGSWGANLYTNNTNYVQINGPNEIEIFAGNVINLEIQCVSPFKKCYHVDIYSSINPIMTHVFKNGWIFECTYGPCVEYCSYCRYLIDIYFTSIGANCSYTVADPGCSFLSFDPTLSPSDSPSYSPSISPSNAPSISPSNSPSQPPTAAPTRFPTVHNAYSKKIRIDYTFSEINKDIIDIIVNDMETVILIIERSYIIAAKGYDDLQYKHFEITIKYYTIIEDNELIISTNIHYEDNSKSNVINLVTGIIKFTNYTETTLRQKYNDTNLLFTANIVEIDSTIPTTFNYMLPILISVMCIGVFLSIAAFVYNKSSGLVDDAMHVAVMVYSLQICDFISDVNLSVEIISQFDDDTNDNKLLLYIAGYGSVLFIVLPYMVNVGLTCRIRKFVKNNSSAVVYFEQRSAFFAVLVILSGGAYATLNIVSSRLFGYEILNSGLTQFELRQLSNIKLFGNVLLENVPQLICQILYILYIRTATNSTTLSFFASSCSIGAALVTWVVQRRTSESFVAQYDLEMVKKHKNIMNESQRNAILKKKECKKSLRRLITSSIKTPETAIELGFVTMTATGCVVHCVQYNLKSELKKFIYDTNGTIFANDTEDDDELYVLASKRMTQQIYKVRKREVNHAFLKHFDFEEGTFYVKYIEKFGYNNLVSKRNLFDPLQLDTPNDSTPQDIFNDGFEKLEGADFAYQRIVSLGIMIKDLLRNDMSYEYMKESLIEKGYGENNIKLWLKWYDNEEGKRTDGDGYDEHEKKENEGGKYMKETTNMIVSNVNDRNIINTDDGIENEIEIEMQTVMREKSNEKLNKVITKHLSSSFKSDNESDYNPQYGRCQSTKL